MMLLVLNWRTSRMFDIKTVQNFSRISSRGVFGQALTDIEPQMLVSPMSGESTNIPCGIPTIGQATPSLQASKGNMKNTSCL